MAGTKVTNHSDHRMREGQLRRRPLQVLLCAWPLVALAAVSEDETQSFPSGGRPCGGDSDITGCSAAGQNPARQQAVARV